MTSPTFVFILCSCGGRVGKTTAARLLADYFSLCERPFAGFDLHPYEPAFATRFPRHALAVDIHSVLGQIALFDGLLVHDEVPKIIDLWHHAVDPFFALWDQTGFVGEARCHGVTPILLFFSEPTAMSRSLADRIARRYPSLITVLVENEGAPTPTKGERTARPAHGFRITALDPFLRETIDAHSFSFSRFMLAPPLGMSIVLRACLKSWILQVFVEIGKLESSLAPEAKAFLG